MESLDLFDPYLLTFLLKIRFVLLNTPLCLKAEVKMTSILMFCC